MKFFLCLTKKFVRRIPGSSSLPWRNSSVLSLLRLVSKTPAVPPQSPSLLDLQVKQFGSFILSILMLCSSYRTWYMQSGCALWIATIGSCWVAFQVTLKCGCLFCWGDSSSSLSQAKAPYKINLIFSDFIIWFEVGRKFCSYLTQIFYFHVETEYPSKVKIYQWQNRTCSEIWNSCLRALAVPSCHPPDGCPKLMSILHLMDYSSMPHISPSKLL